MEFLRWRRAVDVKKCHIKIAKKGIFELFTEVFYLYEKNFLSAIGD